MKKFPKIFLSLMCAAFLALPVFAACDKKPDPDKKPNDPPALQEIDYASKVALDFSDDTSVKQKVTVKHYIDGDTTHFFPVNNADAFAATDGIIKARYLAVNTPESTGVIEKWGKTASLYTESKLSTATEIYIESNDTKWNVDSTGDRYLLWIWYLPAGESQFRNLNIELLQEGYGKGSAIVNSRYETEASAALLQAQNLKYHVWSPASTVDPNFFDGEAAHITLQELRFHAADYEAHAVRVEGTVVARFSNTAYIEDYNDELDISYGFSVYYGFATGKILDILKVGNRVSVCGKVTEFQGTYQISDVDYDRFDPMKETNTFKLDENTHEAPFKLTDAAAIVNGTGMVKAEYYVMGEDGEPELKAFSIDSREAMMATSVELRHLKITRMYTTVSTTSSNGAISIYCEDDNGIQITIRTQVLKKSNGELYTQEDFKVGGYIDVKGIIDKYTSDSGKVSYQVAVHKFENIIQY